MTKDELEELIKSVNRNAIKAMLRNATVINRPDMSNDMKNQAIENVKAIVANKPNSKKMDQAAAIKVLAPKNAKKPKAGLPLKKEPVVAAVHPAPAAPIVPAAAPIKPELPVASAVPMQPVAPTKTNLEYPEDFHLGPGNTEGHDEAHMRSIFDGLSDNDKMRIINWHNELKMQKSIDELHNLFTQLKKLS